MLPSLAACGISKSGSSANAVKSDTYPATSFTSRSCKRYAKIYIYIDVRYRSPIIRARSIREMSCLSFFFGLSPADAGLFLGVDAFVSFFLSFPFPPFSFAKLWGIAGGFLEPDLPLPWPLPRPRPRPRPRPLPETFLGGGSLNSDEHSPLSSSVQPAAFLNAFWASCNLITTKKNCWKLLE